MVSRPAEITTFVGGWEEYFLIIPAGSGRHLFCPSAEENEQITLYLGANTLGVCGF